MKDYTKQIPIPNDPTAYPVKFYLSKSGDRKLKLIKTLKITTGLGLRESKEIVDEVNNQPISFTIKLTPEQLKKFKEDLRNCDNIEYRLDDISRMRSRKLIQLGIASKQDLIEELIDYNINFVLSHNLDEVTEFLNEIYSLIDENKLNSLYENIMIPIKD